jgi:lipoic acid synthetase
MGRIRRLPKWLKRPLPSGAYAATDRLLEDLRLNTVCRGAKCPNIFECYGRGTATFLILGTACTRSCTFCAIGSGPTEPVDEDEPVRVAEAAKRLKLKHVVITSVTRDDLSDGGAAYFAAVIREIRKVLDCTIEVLTPDFQGDESAIRAVLEARPDVYNHNIETVSRLYPEVRPGADYERSLALLKLVGTEGVNIHTKSGMMLGLGESGAEIEKTLHDIRKAGCEILTIGQYLAPSENHHAIDKFYTPEEFEEWKQRALDLDFKHVFSAPFVRRSYRAESIF